MVTKHLQIFERRKEAFLNVIVINSSLLLFHSSTSSLTMPVRLKWRDLHVPADPLTTRCHTQKYLNLVSPSLLHTSTSHTLSC